MNLRILLCGAASLSVFRLVSARPQIPAPPPTGQCVVQEAGRTYIGTCTTVTGGDEKVVLKSPSCNANAGENCRVGQMPCSSQYNFFCVNENTGCFAAQNLHTYPTYTGEKLGQFEGICPQDLKCCHGCSGKECSFHETSSNAPSIEPLQIADLPPTYPTESLSTEGFQLYNTAFDLAETIPKVPNAGTPSPPNVDTNNFGSPSSSSATDLLRSPNSQDIPPSFERTTSDFFQQAPVKTNGNLNLDQQITLPVENRPVENQLLEQPESPLFDMRRN